MTDRENTMRDQFSNITKDYSDGDKFFRHCWEFVCFEDDIDALRYVTNAYYGHDESDLDVLQDERMRDDMYNSDFIDADEVAATEEEYWASVYEQDMADYNATMRDNIEDNR